MRPAIFAVALAVAGLQAAGTASSISVGGVEVAVPEPGGFTKLTQDMQPYYQLRQSLVAASNVNFAVYIPDDVAPLVRAGGVPTFERHLAIETSLQTVSLSVTPALFDQFREVMRSQNEEILNQVREEMPGYSKGVSDRLSDALDTNVALEVADLVPLEPHEDTASAFAYSMITASNLTLADGSTQRIVVSATLTLLNINGRIVFVYVFGGPDDLEWTRAFSGDWTASIRAANE